MYNNILGISAYLNFIRAEEPSLQDGLRLEVFGYLLCQHLCTVHRFLIFSPTKIQKVSEQKRISDNFFHRQNLATLQPCNLA